MTELTPAPDTDAAPLGLAARIAGVIFSPRRTYAAVAARPSVVGVFVVTLTLSAVLAYWLLTSDAGQHALAAQLENAQRQAAAQGREITAQQQRMMETIFRVIGVVAPIATIVVTPAIIALAALLLRAILNFTYGMRATFRQLFAVLAHSTVIMTAVSVLATPLMYVKEDLASPTRLGVLLPMLPEDGFLTALGNSIDLRFIWWLCNLSIGLAVLYKRKTGGIAGTFLGLYGCIVLVMATVRSSFN